MDQVVGDQRRIDRQRAGGQGIAGDPRQVENAAGRGKVNGCVARQTEALLSYSNVIVRRPSLTVKV